jgi:hypothetical protein
VAAQRPVSSCVALSGRACAVPPASDARGGGDNSSRVGVASRGEVAAVVRSWGSTPRPCEHGGGGEEGRREAQWRGRAGHMPKHGDFE